MKKKPGPKKGQRFGGRQKGTPNKLSRSLKEAILEAAEAAGGPGGTVAYLRKMAFDNSSGFLSLLGRVLPLQITGSLDSKVTLATIGMSAADAAAAYATSLKGGTPDDAEEK